MFDRLRHKLYKTHILRPHQAIDRLRYLKRLATHPTATAPYVSDKDREQFSPRNDVLIRSRGEHCHALFLCNPRSHIDRGVIRHGLFHNRIFRALLDMATPTSTILDVGANVGSISIPLAIRLPQAQVFAFEPNPHALARLERNRSLNRLHNLQIVAKGVGDCPGHLTLNLFDDASGDIGLSSFLTPSNTEAQIDRKAVEVTTLDTYANQFDRPVSAIKIDVQGFEAEVLEGGGELISTQRPRILLEHEDINFTSADAASEAKQRLRRFFDDRGYEVFYLTRHDPELLFPVEWQRPLNGDLLALPRS